MGARTETAMRWLGDVCGTLMERRTELGDRGTLNVLLIAQAAAQLWDAGEPITTHGIAHRLSWCGWASCMTIDEYIDDLRRHMGGILLDETPNIEKELT